MLRVGDVAMEVRAIRAGEEASAGALVYEMTRGVRPDEAELAAFLDQARVLGTDWSRQVVAATSQGRIVGCAMYLPMPDRTAAATLPLCAPAFDREELRIELLRALRKEAAQAGVLMLQAYCEVDDAKTHDTLMRSGFDELAVMLFMERQSVDSDHNTAPDRQIRWVPYDDGRHDDFVRVVRESTKGTLDCARLGEFRDVSLTLAGYRSRGRFDPSLWILAEIADEPAACLLLVHHGEDASYEVAYLAVVPSHRGKGLGRKVMKRGLSEVALRSAGSTLTLAVDEANTPAVKLYRELGFRVVDRRRVCFSLLATA